jgi:predicted Holliday junction resolvase-like endonuclease
MLCALNSSKMGKNKNQEIIEMLKKGNFYAECPNCSEEIPLKKAGLFDNDNFSKDALEIYQEQLLWVKQRKEELKKLKETGATKSGVAAKAINIGFILERLAPTMGGFRFNHTDCRALFDPIDYIIFEGLSARGQIDKIFFVDIKTGSSRLTKKQREIKTIINDQKVNFKKY